MSKIFILANTIDVYKIAYIFHYSRDNEMDEVVITSEIFIENVYEALSVPFICFSSVEECVAYSDAVIIIDQEKLPYNSVERVKKLVAEQGKKCYELQMERARSNLLEKKDIQKSVIDDGGVPAILILSVGACTIPSRTEMALNHIMKKEGANFFQFFSEPTRDILTQLSVWDIYSDAVRGDFEETPDVAICFLDLRNDLTHIRRYLPVFDRLRPDYIVALVDFNFQDYEKIKWYVKCIGAKSLDCIIRSRWFSVDDGLICHSDHAGSLRSYYEDILVLDAENKQFDERLQFDILSKITLMEGIKRL